MNKYYLKIGLVLISLMIVSAFVFQPELVTAQKKTKTAAVKIKSLCQANEQTIWSCATTKNKIASVCASKDLAEDKGYVQYRFGAAGKVELEFPKDRAGSQKSFKYSRYTRYMVTMLTLSFENGGFTYTIHDDENFEEKTSNYYDVVDITNGEKEVSSVVCKQPTKGTLMTLEDFVPRDEEK
jgi:hypothetical protein